MEVGIRAKLLQMLIPRNENTFVTAIVQHFVDVVVLFGSEGILDFLAPAVEMEE